MPKGSDSLSRQRNRGADRHLAVNTEIEIRQPRNGMATFLLVICAAAFMTAAFVRLLGIDGTRYMIATTSLIPYITVAGLLIGLFALARKRWVIGLTMTF